MVVAMHFLKGGPLTLIDAGGIVVEGHCVRKKTPQLMMCPIHRDLGRFEEQVFFIGKIASPAVVCHANVPKS